MAERSALISHRFKGPADRVWQALADTARYNEAAGFPRHTIAEIPQGDGTQRFRGRARVGPFEVAWNDVPCNWVRGRWFEHIRLFEGGPVERLAARLDLTPEREGGCTGAYRVEAEGRGVAGTVVARSLVRSGGRAFAKLATEADAWALGERQTPFEAPSPELPAEARGRAERIGRDLEAAGVGGDGLAARLVGLVLAGAESDTARMRPLALARRWTAEPERVVRLCLEATRRGLLALSWDLLCPRCRGAKVRTASLDELPTGGHCGTCAVDYGRDFSRNVEATFRPAEAIRPAAGGEFCLLGPMSTPHIVAHLTLRPGEEREVGSDLPPGPYRFRTLEPGPELELEHAGGTPLPTLRYDGDSFAAVAGDGRLALANVGPHPRTFVVEDRAWVRDALTGDRLTALQSFRDLFSDQVLRPGDEVGIERVALLFSDLRGSTALYERVGDAAAYQRVRQHFEYLQGAVRRHDGAIVKTIGDAVMAVFADPARGVAAALAMQDRVGELNAAADEAPLVLKLGVHAGPCIAVTLNDRLDYFGRTVNLAARLQGASEGGDVVLSAELAGEPEVAPLLNGRRLERGETGLRGFAEPVPLVRVVVEGAGQPRTSEAGSTTPGSSAGSSHSPGPTRATEA